MESKYPPSICGISHKQEEDQYQDHDNGFKRRTNYVAEDDELADLEDEKDHDNGFKHMHEDDDLVDKGDNDTGNEGDDDTDDGGGRDNDEENIEEDDVDNGVKDVKPIINRRSYDVEVERQPKKRRLENLTTNHEFSRPFGSQNSPTEWTKYETLVLLDAWGDRFLQRGRKSLRSEDWQEVAENVSEISKTARTDSQCRNRLDSLKKKYKIEKKRLKQAQVSSSKWVYFKKMDRLMTASPPRVRDGLSCGLDTGQYVFTSTQAYLNHANGLDELRDSPGNSNSAGKNDSEEHSPKIAKVARIKRRSSTSSSYNMLADSILNFCKTYEKLELCRIDQMIELEKTRMSFIEELEIQKKTIIARAKQNIAKILRPGDKESSDSWSEKASSE